jgi:hypothetical protein
LVNDHLLFWVELFSIFGKKPSKLLLVKDFMAKRSARTVAPKDSIVFDINWTDFEIKERDVSKVKESVFNLREHIDPKM